MPVIAFDNEVFESREDLEDLEYRNVNGNTSLSDINTEDKNRKDIIYGIEDVPPWYQCLLLGFQHYMTMIGATLTIPLILTPMLCIAEDDTARGQLVSTIIFASGIITLLQTTVGCRLPIVQGGTFTLLAPTISILTTSFPSCDEYNLGNMTQPEKDELWMTRMREIQGAIIVSCMFEAIIGFTGLIGYLLSWISPLALVPTVSLVGLSLFKEAAKTASGHWGIAILTIILLVVFSEAKMKMPFFSLAEKKLKWADLQLFNMFPMILSILISWAFCAILTATDALPPNSLARTDTKLSLLKNSLWFYVPYPFQWGMPIVTVSGVIGMLAAVISSIMSAIGDYYACAKLAGASLPPKHAVNRGIAIEGVGGVIAGILGTGNGTASYTENIGAIRMTKVASRRVIQTGAFLMILCGCFGKFGAFFVTLPSPVIGGVFLIMFAIITAVGLSILQYVDLNSSRNLLVLGISIFFGLAISEWVIANSEVIKTGSVILDQVITVLLSTHMFLGLILGIGLDNVIPGSDDERGLTKWRTEEGQTGEESSKDSCYDLPFGMDFFRRVTWCSKIPISPTFVKLEKKTNQL